MGILILFLTAYGLGLRESIAVANSHCAVNVLFSLWEEEY